MSRKIPSIAFFLAFEEKAAEKGVHSMERRLQLEEAPERGNIRKRRLQEAAPGGRHQENAPRGDFKGMGLLEKAVRREGRCSGKRILWDIVPERRSYRRMVGVYSERGWKLKDEEKSSSVGGRAGSRARKKTLHDKEEEALREERGGG